MRGHIKGLGVAIGIGMLLAASAPAWATDITNQDSKTYKVTIVVGSVTSWKTLKAGGEIYGICNADDCRLSIPGSAMAVGRNDRIIIKGGKLTKA